MDLWISWIALGVLFLIVEFSIGLRDFLILTVSAILIGIFSYLFEIDSLILTFIIFFLLGGINIIILNFFIKPSRKKNNLNENIPSGEKFIVKTVKGEKKIFFDGNYYDIESTELIYSGDTVETLNETPSKQGTFKVKKII